MHLSLTLKKIGYRARFVVGVFHINRVDREWVRAQISRNKPILEHCWVEVSGNIVDITATQFGLPKIYVPTQHQRRKRYAAVERDHKAVCLMREDWIFLKSEHNFLTMKHGVSSFATFDAQPRSACL